VGHSQGGQAALFAAANAPGRVDGLIAVAAIAPANHPLQVVQAGAWVPAPDEGYAFTPLFLAGAIGGSIADAATGEAIKIIDPQQVLSVKAYEFWPQVWEKSRAELSHQRSFGGLKGNEQFRIGYLADPNDDQREFNRQLAKMNPDLDISVPVRITQARADERVRYEPPLNIPGTKELINELEARHANDITPRIYGPHEVSNETEPLKAHFTTINVDTGELIDWLIECGLVAS
jgi:pimeloyl-ACP methyl ester carboxylesterase